MAPRCARLGLGLLLLYLVILVGMVVR